MPLPPPPASSTATATATAPAPAPVAATETAPAAAGTKIVAKFGSAKDAAGNPAPIPRPNGLDVIAFRDALKAVVAQHIGDSDAVAALIEEFARTPKSAFPGSKQGKQAFAIGNVLRNLFDAPKVEREKKARTKAVDKFKNILGKLANQFGGKDKLRAVLNDEDLKGLDLGL